ATCFAAGRARLRSIPPSCTRRARAGSTTRARVRARRRPWRRVRRRNNKGAIMSAAPSYMATWSPGSWTTKPAQQQVGYADQAALARVIDEIGRLPPLVTWGEIDRLRAERARAARGEAFVLQGGDCAESFDDCRSEPIAAKLKILLQMSLVLVHGTRKPIVRIGRIAGQYAKPRSADLETRGGVTLPAY